MGRKGCDKGQEAGCEKGSELGVKRCMIETSINTYQLDKSLNSLTFVK